MPTVDLTPYDQAQGSTSDGTKFTNLIAAIQSTINALDDANISPAAAIAYTKLALTGKLVNTDLSAAAAIAISKLAGYPTDGSKALFGDGTWQTVGASNVGTQLDYAQIVADSAGITATTEGTSVAVITGNSVVYDGTKVKIEFDLHHAASGALNAVYVLYRDTTVLGHWSPADTLGSGATFGMYRQAFDTPGAGAHTYTLKAYVGSNTLTVKAGAGGSGNLPPAFLRVTKA